MKKIVTERPSFQGDLAVWRIAAIPADAEPVAAAGNDHVLAHSETGHHHVVASRNAQLLIDRTNEMIGYLRVEEETVVRHLRGYDTHAELTLPPGVYEVRRAQREYVPEGWRRVAD